MNKLTKKAKNCLFGFLKIPFFPPKIGLLFLFFAHFGIPFFLGAPVRGLIKIVLRAIRIGLIYQLLVEGDILSFLTAMKVLDFHKLYKIIQNNKNYIDSVEVLR